MQRVKYKIENWGEYNKSLIHRGRITLWVEEEAIESWINADKSGKRGCSYTYSGTMLDLEIPLQTSLSCNGRMGKFAV